MKTQVLQKVWIATSRCCCYSNKLSVMQAAGAVEVDEKAGAAALAARKPASSKQINAFEAECSSLSDEIADLRQQVRLVPF